MESPIIAVSDKSNLQVVCRLEETKTDTTGAVVGKKKRLVAQFQRGGAPTWVIEEAQKRFTFKGRAEGEPLAMMIGVFDSAETAQRYKWSEDEHDAVVRHLRDTANPYWFVAEEPRAPAPWPSYDEVTIQGSRTWEKVAAQHLATAAATGFPLQALIVYERQNRNDDRVLAAYERAERTGGQVELAEELVEIEA